MARRLEIVILALLVFGTAESSAQGPTLGAAMREKLVNTQQLLEAVVKADYATMAQYAERLSRISYTEIGSWQTNPRPDYIRQATAFLSAVQGMRDAAAKKSLEDATKQYTALITSCIQCHAYVRSSRVASAAPLDMTFPAHRRTAAALTR
jgi:hypothetical protein